MPLKCVFRVDSSSQIGAGHVMRCLTLANYLRDRQVTCVFVCRDYSGNIGGKIAESGFEVCLLPSSTEGSEAHGIGINQEADAEAFSALMVKGADWFIVDHYALDDQWENFVRAKFPNTKIMVIDDLADRPHACDVLLDLSPGREASDYQSLVDSSCELLIGLEYALLRPEFSKARQNLNGPPRTMKENPEILVTFGGGHVFQPAVAALDALGELIEHYSFHIRLVGEFEAVEIAPELHGHLEKITFEPDMAKRIGTADLLVCAAGGTSWERCCLGVPAIVLMVAENQRLNFEGIEASRSGLCVETDKSSIKEALRNIFEDGALYRELAENAWQLCDGKGGQRVADMLVSRSLEVVSATMADARFVYEARYAGNAAEFYKHAEQPAFEHHVKWFENALVIEDCVLLCIRMGKENVAHVRFDLESGIPDKAEIGIALSPQFRGKGLARAVMMAAIEHARQRGIHTISAEVHPENTASITLFEASGFVSQHVNSQGFVYYLNDTNPVGG
ncbi:MAG: UDP-2,4-diacetamido-2,4,6-trideoxy-beta-L-altropyranose hydrolase [Pseudomonadota bacterium]